MERTTVEKEGFYGIYHPVSDGEEKSVVIVLGGSEGNENIPVNVGAKFAEQGIPALGICYWNVPGLPDQLIRVPLEPFEKAVEWLRKRGFEQIFIYGISKGGELALLVASLISEICGVIALSPIHCVWGGMKGNKGLLNKTFTKQSEFTWRGKDFPCMIAELKYGPAVKNLLCHRQFELSYMYENPLKNFDESAAIPVEKINGDILFIYAEKDLMWPSREAVAYMQKRLNDKGWRYRVQELCYEKASHILVPLDPPALRMFRVERQFAEECRKNRRDAFEKTVAWIKERSINDVGASVRP